MTMLAARIALGAICILGSSFVTTAALRNARGEAFVGGRSRCDGCGARLSYAATVPFISYFWFRGQGACCGEEIDPVHLLGELAGLGLAIVCVACPDLLQASLLAMLGLALLATSVVDSKTGRLPDVLTVFITVLGLGLCGLRGGGVPMAGICAALLAAFLLEAVRLVFLRITGRGGLGQGDVKLFAALALWLGWATPLALTVASAIGLAYAAVRRPPGGQMAFGPALAFGSFAVGLAQSLWISSS